MRRSKGKARLSLAFSTSSNRLSLIRPSAMEIDRPATNGDGAGAAEEMDLERPFLRRSSSGSRRRRTAGETPLGSPSRRPSFRQEMGHAAAETYLITRLTLILLRYLGVGSRWITKFLALGFYALLLMPGFIQVGYYYFFSNQVRRSVIYGEQPRNRLDLYLPINGSTPKPVVAFVTGGAWIIGYKAWGALLGRRLAERDVIVACIDYRIHLMGQSAGAHIAACALVDQALREHQGENTSWSMSQIKTYFGLSGGYNLFDLVDHVHRRGLYRSIFLSIMEGEQSLQRFSPELTVQDQSFHPAIIFLPQIILFHGTGDYSIPSTASENFASALRSVGAQVKLILYEGKTHTDLFLQDPLRGGRDDLLEDVVAVIHAGDAVALAKDTTAPKARRLVPEWQLKLAREISPF
uniref:protein-S-isoprenylcysteine alpha-carbonyl methylesterase n=1 Tax=Musa acuminata subsp. malaccensis TaxID=214687 RepID=A0A804ITP8_MUSAM